MMKRWKCFRDIQPRIWPVLVLAVLTVGAPVAIAQDSIRIRLVNEYFAKVIGNERSGADTVEGTLRRQTATTWTGEVQARVGGWQELKPRAAGCPRADFRASQRLHMSARSVTGFNSGNQGSQTIQYQSGRANAFLALAVEPAEEVDLYFTGLVRCLDLYQKDPNSFHLLPLNDARWRQPQSGYIIGLPERGVLVYEDHTISSSGPEALLLELIGTGGTSTWKIRVERP